MNSNITWRRLIRFSLVGILQSGKTMVSRFDLWFSNIALRGWKDQFGNDSLFRTLSRCGQIGFLQPQLCCTCVHEIHLVEKYNQRYRFVWTMMTKCSWNSQALTNHRNNYVNTCFLLPLPFTTRLESSRLGPEAAAAAAATGTRLCRGLCIQLSLSLSSSSLFSFISPALCCKPTR